MDRAKLTPTTDSAASTHALPPRRLAPFHAMSTELQRYWLAIGLGSLLAAFLLVAQLGGVFDGLEDALTDWRQSLPALRPEPDYQNQLALVAIDYIPADRPWPWPRLDYVIVLRSLLPYAPKSLVFETLLHDRDTRYSAFDSTFGSLVNRLDHVVFAAAALSPEVKAPPPSNLTPIATRGSLGNMPRYGSCLWPLEAFAGSATVGISNLMPETNGQVRRLPLLFRYQNLVIPALTLQAVAQNLGASWKKSDAVLGEAIFLRHENGQLLRAIPIDCQGRLRLRLRPNATAFWTASFNNVPLYDQQHERGEAPELNLSELRGRQVWIGRSDRRDLPPVGQTLGHHAAIELQMLATCNILNNDFIRPPSPWALAIAYLIFSAIGSAVYLRYGPISGAVFCGILTWTWWETSFTLFRATSLDLPLMSFTLLAVGLAAVAYAALEWELKPVDRQLSLGLK